MIIAGVILVFLTFYAIVKNYETRVVLIVSGLLMAFIGGDIGAALDAFAKGLVNPSLTPIICVTMGFSAVLDATGCSRHLVVAITKLLNRVKIIIVPATILMVWLINISLLSASGLAAAVGAILIPTLIRLGVRTAMAASTVLLGTWGSSVSPGNPFIVQVADLAGEDIMVILQSFAPKAFVCAVFAAIILFVIARVRGELSGSGVVGDGVEQTSEEFRVKPLRAVVPLVPIVILILASPAVKLLPAITITNAMLLGTFFCLLVTRPEIKGATGAFFRGAGSGFASIVCLIAAAGMFIEGMNKMGLTDALIVTMANSASIAKFSATFGPFLLAAISGSGNAAVLAFNGTVTPHATTFGLGIADMGAVVQAAGNIGRSMSPVAGVTIICAELAHVNPMELAKRNAIPCISAALLMMFIVLV